MFSALIIAVLMVVVGVALRLWPISTTQALTVLSERKCPQKRPPPVIAFPPVVVQTESHWPSQELVVDLNKRAFAVSPNDTGQFQPRRKMLACGVPTWDCPSVVCDAANRATSYFADTATELVVLQPANMAYRSEDDSQRVFLLQLDDDRFQVLQVPLCSSAVPFTVLQWRQVRELLQNGYRSVGRDNVIDYEKPVLVKALQERNGNTLSGESIVSIVVSNKDAAYIARYATGRILRHRRHLRPRGAVSLSWDRKQPEESLVQLTCLQRYGSFVAAERTFSGRLVEFSEDTAMCGGGESVIDVSMSGQLVGIYSEKWEAVQATAFPPCTDNLSWAWVIEPERLRSEIEEAKHRICLLEATVLLQGHFELMSCNLGIDPDTVRKKLEELSRRLACLQASLALRERVYEILCSFELLASDLETVKKCIRGDVFPEGGAGPSKVARVVVSVEDLDWQGMTSQERLDLMDREDVSIEELVSGQCPTRRYQRVVFTHKFVGCTPATRTVSAVLAVNLSGELSATTHILDITPDRPVIHAPVAASRSECRDSQAC